MEKTVFNVGCVSLLEDLPEFFEVSVHKRDTLSLFCMFSVSHMYLTTFFFVLKLRKYCYHVDAFSPNNLDSPIPFSFFPTHTDTLLQLYVFITEELSDDL